MTAPTSRPGCFASAMESFGVAASDGVLERRFRLAGATVAIRFAGPCLVSALGDALAHHPRCRSAPDLVVNVWDGRSGAPAPRIATDALDGGITVRARIEGAQPVECRYDGQRRILSVYDRASRTAGFWVADPDDLPHWERASPFRQLLAWFFRARGLQLLHAAAVGGPHAGLLLVGRGGSGKSTSALACLEWPEPGIGVAGDDYCVVATGAPARAWSLYRSAKVAWSVLSSFRRLSAAVVNRGTPDEKALLMLGPPHSVPVSPEVALDAIVVPQVDAPGPTFVEPLAKAAALRSLAASSILQLAGPNADDLRDQAVLVAGRPAWRLVLGGEPDRVPGVLAGALGRTT